MVPPESKEMHRYFQFFKVLLERSFAPLSSIQVETVNGKPVRESEYATCLEKYGFERDYKRFTLRRRY
jgi:hypothetical protein